MDTDGVIHKTDLQKAANEKLQSKQIAEIKKMLQCIISAPKNKNTKRKVKFKGFMVIFFWSDPLRIKLACEPPL